MKQFWQDLKNSEYFPLVKLLGAALLLRLVLVPWAYHSDLNNHVIWGIYAEEFGLRGFYDWLNFGNYARPDYPPIAVLLFLLMRWIWLGVHAVLWEINVSIALFPSGIMAWFDAEGYFALLKLPGIVADLAIGGMIYGWAAKQGVKRPGRVAGWYLFNPAVIYISAVWGQIDAVVGALTLGALILILRGAWGRGALSQALSMMVKQTGLPVWGIVLVKGMRERVGWGQVAKTAVAVAGIYYGLAYVFIDGERWGWLVRTYRDKFLPGPATLHFMNLNAFNAWGAVLGLERVSDEVRFGGAELGVWAWVMGGLIAAAIVRKYWRGKEVFFSSLMLYYAIFLFFPRMHERYMYPMFVFFPLVLVYAPKLKRYFYLLSAVFLINLYHWWWVPRVGFLASLLELELVERGLSVLNVILFWVMWREYDKSEHKWKLR